MAKRLCLEANDRQGFYPMNQLTFLVLPVLASVGDFHGIEHVAVLIRKNFLLTLRDERATQLQKTISLQDSNEWLPGKCTGFSYRFLDCIIIRSTTTYRRT